MPPLGSLLAVLGLLLCSALATAGPPGGPRAVRDGSLLLDETFTGDSVRDEGFMPLDTACLTGASAPPAAGESAIGPCDDPGQTTAPVPTPGVTPGWLQLTDNANYHVGGLLYNRPLPGNGGLEVTFEQYQYGGNGADGIGFFLVDGGVDLTHAGADGGSLGYAQRNLTPGVDGGYLGVGLDAYGNFAGDGEQRGLGCPTAQQSPVDPAGQVTDSVTLRGPGQDLDQYCFMASTMRADPTQVSGYSSTLPGSLRSAGTDAEAAKRAVRLTLSPDAKPLVTVEIDFEDGKGFQQVLSRRMTAAAVKTYKFGFSGSTGGLTDTHLIRELHVRSAKPLDGLNLVKTVDKELDGEDTTYQVGDTVHYRFRVSNTGDEVLDPVEISDPEVSDISCPRGRLGPAGSPTATMECTGSHVLTAEDAYPGKFTNTATAKGSNPGGDAVPSNPSSAAVEVEGPRAHLEITKTATPVRARPGDVVTYTLVARNAGEADLSPADFTDDLAGVLDDADYDDDARASTGTVGYDAGKLRWSGDLAAGERVTVTYSVTVHDPDRGDLRLRNSVGSTLPGTTCGAGGTPPCVVDVPVVPRRPSPSPSPTASPSAGPGPVTSPPPSATPAPHGPTGGLPDTGLPSGTLVAGGLAALGVVTGAGILLVRRLRAN